MPTGTVTFVFTDIEGSTRLVRHLGRAYERVLQAHHDILREALGEAGGFVVRTAGDSFFVAFRSAEQAVLGVVEAQRRLLAHRWPDGATVRVRIGIHTGEGPPAADDYGGIDVNRAARISAAAHGGQVVVSAATSQLVEQLLPVGVGMRDLGEHVLRDLDRPEHLYQLLIPGLENDFPPLRSIHPVVGNLPVQLDTFVGRTTELDELTRLFAGGARQVTLVGPGGTGKTRVAVELGRAIRHLFADGVFLVPLAAERDAARVLGAVARALELREVGGQSLDRHVSEVLSGRNVLLILDNFEHLLDAAPSVSALLSAAPALGILVTSRTALRIAGEQQYLIEPLGLAAGSDLEEIVEAEAVQLFAVRARAASRAFELRGPNARVVADLCARLDGLPLAIELAAARTPSLGPAAILARIDQRLDSLIGGGGGRAERHRTLRATIAWSHDLLDDSERRIFARLSVFAGGARLDDVEAVCGPSSELGRDVAELVGGLVDHSLLRHVGADADARFEMLETIREFALEQLTESGQDGLMRDRHAARFAELARVAEPQLMGPAAAEWVERFEREHDNVSAALDHLMDFGPADLAVRMVAMLWRAWQMSGRLAEGRRRTEQALDLESGRGDPGARRMLLEAAGGIAYWQGDFLAAGRLYEAALDLARDDGDRRLIADGLYNLGFARALGFQATNDTGEGWARGIAMLEESVRLYGEIDDRAGRAKALWGLSEAARTSGDLTNATALIEECLGVFRELGDAFHTGWVLRSLTLLQRDSGDPASARASAIEGLRLFHSRSDVTGTLFFLSALARLALDDGDIERGLRLAGATRSLQLLSGAALVGTLDSFAGITWEEEIARLGPDAPGFWQAGTRMSMDDAVEYAEQVA